MECTDPMEEGLTCMKGDGCKACRNDRGGAWSVDDIDGGVYLEGIHWGGSCWEKDNSFLCQ